MNNHARLIRLPWKTTLFYLAMIVVTNSCRQDMRVPALTSKLDADAAPVDNQESESFERKLIKDGTIEFETASIDSTRKTILQAVERYHGYIASDQEHHFPGKVSNILVLRVPAANFDNLLDDITKGVSRVENKEINIHDVTEEYLDVNSRLKAKKEIEMRYLELLKQAKTVTEILEIEKQLGELRTDIESVEGRMKYLENKVALATLTVDIYEKVSGETAFGGKFRDGFSNGWDNFIWVLVGLANIWPLMLIVVAAIIGVRLYRRK